MSEIKKSRAARRGKVADIQDVIAKPTIHIPVIRITNPFNPREFVREELTWQSGKTLLDYFPAPSIEAVISINGKIVPRDQYALTYLDRTDNLVVCPIPTGGGDGDKSILMMVAMIAVAVFAPYVAAGLNTALGTGFAAGSMGMAALTVGVSMAGSMLVNALLAPPQKTEQSSAEKLSSYGVDGAKNTSLEGICVPVCYGEFRMGGNILGLHVSNDADESQTLYMLISAGEGPVSAISNIQINDTPLENFVEVETQTRLGSDTQSSIPWFDETIVAINKNQKLSQNWFYHQTERPVDKLRLDLVAPQGLCTISLKKGDSSPLSVPLDIEYRVANSNAAWAVLPTTNQVESWIAVEQVVTEVIDPVTLQSAFTISWINATTRLPVTSPAALEYLATAPTESPVVAEIP